MILLSNSIANKKRKKTENTIQQKKTKQERKKIFLILCQLYLATLLIKKNTFFCVTFTWSFLHQVQQRRRSRYCVTYTCPTLLLKKICLLCHLYLAQFDLLLYLLPCHGYPPVLCHLYLASKLYSSTEEDDFQLCHLYLATLLLKKICATVSPLLGPVHLVLPRKKTLLNCVTYTWPHLICFSICRSVLDTTPTVSPIPAPVYKKKAGTTSKKFNILQAPLRLMLYCHCGI